MSNNKYIYYLITEYFVFNKRLTLPFIGSFEIIDRGATFDKKTMFLIHSGQDIVFKSSALLYPDQSLFDFLKSKFQKDDDYVKVELFTFIENIMTMMRTKVFVWKNIGTLKLNTNREIVFEKSKESITNNNKVFKVKEFNQVAIEDNENTQNLYTQYSLREYQKLSKTLSTPPTVEKVQLSVDSEAYTKNDSLDYEAMQNDEIEKIIPASQDSDIEAEIKEMLYKETQQNPQQDNFIINDKLQQSATDALPENFAAFSNIENSKYNLNALHLKKEETDNLIDKSSDSSVYFKTEFLDTALATKYNIFQKVFIITVLIVSLLYLFFHLFLNDFSFHSFYE